MTSSARDGSPPCWSHGRRQRSGAIQIESQFHCGSLWRRRQRNKTADDEIPREPWRYWLTVALYAAKPWALSLLTVAPTALPEGATGEMEQPAATCPSVHRASICLHRLAVVWSRCANFLSSCYLLRRKFDENLSSVVGNFIMGTFCSFRRNVTTRYVHSRIVTFHRSPDFWPVRLTIAWIIWNLLPSCLDWVYTTSRFSGLRDSATAASESPYWVWN
jgi:hypothetical protein